MTQTFGVLKNKDDLPVLDLYSPMTGKETSITAAAFK